MLFDDGRILFFDDRDIESSENVTLTLNPPVKRGPCLRAEAEWEENGCRGLCVLEWEGVYRFYYQVCPFGDDRMYLAFAVSTDGIEWERPDLGVVEFNGSRSNNLVSIEGAKQNEGCVFVDPSAPDEERFKLVGHSQFEGGMYVMTSPDGITFKRQPNNLFEFILDNHNTSFYDSRIGKYVIYSRGWDRDRPIPPLEGSRTIIRIEAAELKGPLPFDRNAPDPWPVSRKWEGLGHENMRRVNKELPTCLAPDDFDPPEADIYQLAGVQYLPDAYLAFPSLYYHHPWAPEGFVNDGYLDLQFASSRDGIAWRRDFRGSYVRLDLPGGWATKMMHMFVGMVPYESILSQYYMGSRYSHGEGRITGDTKVERPKIPNAPFAHRLEQRMDGFVSADSAYTGGVLITRPFVLRNPQLRLNIDTSASGVAWAALLDEDGNAIPGYSLEDSDRIQGNDTQWLVSWRKSSDLSQFVGRRVKLLLKSRSAKLFAVYP